MTSLKDPRLQGVSVTEVRARSDLSFATAYVRTDDGSEEGVEALQHASGFIRRQLALSLHLRKIPEFRFVADTLPARARRIDDLLRGVKEAGGGQSEQDED